MEIAKKYGSTVDDIVRVNGIENPDKINIGEKIYIPKYVLKRAKEPISNIIWIKFIQEKGL